MPLRDIVGHRRLVCLLSRAVHGGTLPPSLILAGPSGVGKRLAALATAQALNCLAPVQPGTSTGDGVETMASSGPDAAFVMAADACGTCTACVRIARGLHPDVLFIEPGDSGSIKIDQVRDVIERAGYRPFEGRRRVVVFDVADAMVTAAQNALLKTLEEPPSLSVFLLVTSRPDMLLPTVRSRCPLLRFRPLGSSEVAAVLTAQGRSEAEARAVAAVADGSVGKAIGESAEALVEAREVAARLLAQAVTTDDPRHRLDVAKEWLARTGAGQAADRDYLTSRLRAMASLLRDVELLSTRADCGALDNPDVAPTIESLAAYRGERGLRAFTAVDRALVALDRNASVKIVADWLVLQL